MESQQTIMFTNKNNILPQFLIVVATILNILIAAVWVQTTGCASTHHQQKVEQLQNSPAPGNLKSPIISGDLSYFSDMKDGDLQDTDILYTFEIFLMDEKGKTKQIMQLAPAKR